MAEATRIVKSESDVFVARGVDAFLSEGRDGEPIIKIDNLQKTYLLGVEGVPALRGVSLEIAHGEFVCIFGTSGGGKTTMLNILGTIDKPTKGSLEICGQRITASTPDTVTAALRLTKIGFVFQSFNLISSLTALENVEMPMILAGVLSAEERRQRAEELLARVGMSERMGHLPTQLSGGEQQRVTIARALANRPEILLLDEPTGDLDTANSAIVLELLLDLNREGITLVMVTHDVGLKWFSERVIWMRDGKIKTVEIVSEEKRQEAKRQLQANLDALRETKRKMGLPSSSSSSSADDQDPDSFVPTFSNTVIRRPHNYATQSALTTIERAPYSDSASFSSSSSSSSVASSSLFPPPPTPTPSREDIEHVLVITDGLEDEDD